MTPASGSGRIPVTLVTGFLGSGKTTLINAALRAHELAHTLVVVNEFGEVGLDHSLFASSNDAVVVLENGCLCCTVRGDLVATLVDLHQRQAKRIPEFDHIVIETSGLAEPGPVLQAFLSDPNLDGLYRVASVLTLVDAVNFAGTLKEHDEALRQVAYADRVLISKFDLVKDDPKAAEAALRATIARLAPAAGIELNDQSAPPRVDLLKTPGFDAADPSADPLPWLALAAHEQHHAHDGHGQDSHDHSHDHGHDHANDLRDRGIESFVLTRTEPMTREELQFLLAGISQNLGPGLLRVKGLVNVAGESGKPAVIHGAQHILHTMTWLDRWPDADERTRIVFIAQGTTRAELKEIVELLDRMSVRTFKARERARVARAQAIQTGIKPADDLRE
jgi:G3E family GTPase